MAIWSGRASSFRISSARIRTYNFIYTQRGRCRALRVQSGGNSLSNRKMGGGVISDAAKPVLLRYPTEKAIGYSGPVVPELRAHVVHETEPVRPVIRRKYRRFWGEGGYEGEGNEARRAEPKVYHPCNKSVQTIFRNFPWMRSVPYGVKRCRCHAKRFIDFENIGSENCEKSGLTTLKIADFSKPEIWREHSQSIFRTRFSIRPK